MVGFLEALSRDAGRTPHMRMTVAMSDGETLYAARYASDEYAPTLYVGDAVVDVLEQRDQHAGDQVNQCHSPADEG